MRFSWSKTWVAAAVAAVIIGAAGCTGLPFLSGPTAVPQTPTPVPPPPARTEVVVNGSLVFPRQVETSFDTAGEVDAVLVSQGDRVAAGQLLARLDPDVTIALRQELSEAVLKVDQTNEALDRAWLKYELFPLEDAQRQRNIVKAEQEIADAEERITDYLYDHSQLVVNAETAGTNAELAVASAEDALADYEEDFLRDRRQRSLDIAALKARTNSLELSMEQIRMRLDNINLDYQDREAKARVAFQQAEVAVEVAEDNVTAFLRDPIPDYNNRKPIDLDILNRLKTLLREAEVELLSRENTLNDLESSRQLEVEEGESQLVLLQSQMDQVREDLDELESFVEEDLGFLRLSAAVDAARVALTQTEHDLAELREGPDEALLAVMRRDVELARERREDLNEEPELLEIEVLEDTLVTVQTRIGEIHEEMGELELYAPISGIVSLVNVAAGDLVTEDSRVLEITDPSGVAIDGIIGANDLPYVRVDSAARVTIDSVPGRKFQGFVAELAEEPRTERGVVSYEVLISVEVPAGVEVPVGLSPVSAIIPITN